VLSCDKPVTGTDLKILTGTGGRHVPAVTGGTAVTGEMLVARGRTSADFRVGEHVTAGDDVTVLLADLALLIAPIVLRYSANAQANL